MLFICEAADHCRETNSDDGDESESFLRNYKDFDQVLDSHPESGDVFGPGDENTLDKILAEIPNDVRQQMLGETRSSVLGADVDSVLYGDGSRMKVHDDEDADDDEDFVFGSGLASKADTTNDTEYTSPIATKDPFVELLHSFHSTFVRLEIFLRPLGFLFFESYCGIISEGERISIFSIYLFVLRDVRDGVRIHGFFKVFSTCISFFRSSYISWQISSDSILCNFLFFSFLRRHFFLLVCIWECMT